MNGMIPCLAYHDARAAIDWLCSAFGFTKKAVHETGDGKIAHAELTYRGSMIMLGSTDTGSPYSKLVKQPADIGGFQTQSPYMVVENVDVHYERAKQHGARIAIGLKTEPHGRSYSCYDPEGHLWNFGDYNPWKS